MTEALADDALSVREIAVLAVGEVRATNAIPALIQALRYDDVRVRRNVADVLSQFQDERVQRAFIDALCAHPDSYVRRLAVQYVAPSGNPQALDALILSLNDEDMPVRVAAAEAMGHFRDPRVVGPLIRAFPDKRTREIAVRLLKALPPEMVRPALFAAATNDNVFIRATAVEMLGQAPDEPAFQILLAAMLDPQGHVRSPAIEAVVRFKDPRGADRLMACLSHTNGMARKEAQAALTRWYGRDYGPDESAWRRKTRPPGLFPRSFPIGQNPKVAFLKLAALMALVWLPFFQQKPFLCAAIYGAVYLLLCPLLGLPLMALWLPALAAIGLSALYFWLLFHFAGDSAIWWPVFLAGCALAAI